MTEIMAAGLIEQYMNGWKQNDLAMMKSCLTDDCVIIESHGPTYHGIAALENWFKLWLQAKSFIERWEMLSIYFCEKEQTAFLEWNFSCFSNNINYAFSGLSMVKFKQEKIYFIHEYRMTHPAYDWRNDELKSE